MGMSAPLEGMQVGGVTAMTMVAGEIVYLAK